MSSSPLLLAGAHGCVIVTSSDVGRCPTSQIPIGCCSCNRIDIYHKIWPFHPFRYNIEKLPISAVNNTTAKATSTSAAPPPSARPPSQRGVLFRTPRHARRNARRYEIDRYEFSYDEHGGATNVPLNKRGIVSEYPA
ncbi:hypothetical protein HN011_006199 [Eciton burchellii]|nr:hypothetical protein HN011_006199 [Eciton burchellii]